MLRCVALLPPPFLMAGFSWDCSLSLQVDLAFKEPKTFSVRDIGGSPPGDFALRGALIVSRDSLVITTRGLGAGVLPAPSAQRQEVPPDAP